MDNLHRVIKLPKKEIKSDLSIDEMLDCISERSKYSLPSLNIERNMVDSIVDTSKLLRDVIDIGDSIITTYKELSYDLFLSLFDPYPKMLHEDNMLDTHKLNHAILFLISQLDEFNTLKEYCMLDLLATGLASFSMHEKIIEMLNELQDNSSIIEDINELNESIESLNENNLQLEIINEIQKENGSNNKIEDILSTIELKNNLLNESIQKSITNINKELSNDNLKELMTNLSTKIVDETLNDLKESLEEMQTWGFGESKERRVPIESKLEALKRIRSSKKLKQFSDKIGFMRKLANQERKTKNKNGASDISGIITGDNLSYSLISEKQLLNNPVFKKDFYKKYLEGNLLQFELNAYEELGKGPIIICVDDSSSMDQDKEIWAKAFSIALIDIATVQKRSFAYINYSSYINQEIIIEKGFLNPNSIVDICDKSFGGGTDFEKPLTRALEILKISKFKKADIVFITDGQCNLDPTFVKQFNQLKKEKLFNCYGLLINIGSRTVSKISLAYFCDTIYEIDSMIDSKTENTIKSIFRNL